MRRALFWIAGAASLMGVAALGIGTASPPPAQPRTAAPVKYLSDPGFSNVPARAPAPAPQAGVPTENPRPSTTAARPVQPVPPERPADKPDRPSISKSQKEALSAAAIAALIIAASRSAYHATGRPCACPDDRMRNGRACGGRSAYSRPGGAAPLCYAHDVTAQMVDQYRKTVTSRTPVTQAGR